MTNLEKIKEFCKMKDFRHQRDILSEEASEMIMILSALNVRYYSHFTNKPTLECYAWIDSLADLEICLTQMAIYCGEASLEKYIYHFGESIPPHVDSMMATKDDIYLLAYLSKMISKARRNDSVTDVAKAFENFKIALYFTIKRFLDDARESLLAKGLTEYYNQVFEQKLDKAIETFKEVSE